jgi:hypothetical protein
MRALAVLLLVVSSSPALADVEPAANSKTQPLGVEVTLRLGPAVPGGFDNPYLTQTPFFPLSLSLGYRFGGLVYVGGTGVYAFGPSVESSATLNQYFAEALAEVAIHPLRYGRFDPWVGIGLGGQWVDQSVVHFVGAINVGLDFALASSFRLGPFFSVQFAADPGQVHEWYIFGLELTGLP